MAIICSLPCQRRRACKGAAERRVAVAAVNDLPRRPQDSVPVTPPPACGPGSRPGPVGEPDEHPPQHMVTYSAAVDHPAGHPLLRHIAVRAILPSPENPQRAPRNAGPPFSDPRNSCAKQQCAKCPKRCRLLIVSVAAPRSAECGHEAGALSAVGGEAQVDAAVARIQPAGGDDLAAGVEVHALDCRARECRRTATPSSRRRSSTPSAPGSGRSPRPCRPPPRSGTAARPPPSLVKIAVPLPYGLAAISSMPSS